MRRVFFAVIVLFAVLLSTGAVQDAELSAPPDVAGSDWLPLGDSFGL